MSRFGRYSKLHDIQNSGIHQRLRGQTGIVADFLFAQEYHSPDHPENSPEFIQLAKCATGSMINAIDAILGGQLNNAIAVIRPPGHHAEPEAGMGYCLFNNVSLAAAHALKNWDLDRILIVDWDVHHGNGTQAAFIDDPRVLFFSVHREDLFPGSGKASIIGEKDGAGYNINVNLPRGSGNDMYSAAFQQILIPVAREFRPQLILISAGFDAFLMDEMGQMKVTVEGYVTMMAIVMNLAWELCRGRILVALEGDYHVPALARCVAEVVDVCTGSRKDHLRTASAPAELEPILDDLRQRLEGYWKNLQPAHQQLQALSYTFDPDQNPPYTWIDVYEGDHRVARVKTLIQPDSFVVCFLLVHPDLRRRGLGRRVVDWLKQSHDIILARNVKFDAEAFWEAVDFSHERSEKTWTWKRCGTN